MSEAPEAADEPKPPRRWRRRLAIAGGVAVALAVLFRVALPTLIERAVPRLAERFGFTASLANVDLALLRGHVTLEGLHATPVAAGDP